MKRNFGNIALWCGIVLLATVACKKKEIEIPEANDPVFRADGTFNEESFSLVAGDNNAYMFTMTESVNNVNVFSGKLSDGLFSVELGIYDGKIDNPGSLAMTEIPNFTSVFSRMSTQCLMVLSKDLLPENDNIQQIEWFIDGVSEGFGDVEIYEPGKYVVKAQIIFNDSTTTSVTNEVIVGYNRTANCEIYFNIDTAGNLIANPVNINPAFPVEFVNWFVDGVQFTQNGGFLQHIVTLAPHKIKAEVHFAEGYVRTKEFFIDPLFPIHNVHDFTAFENAAISTIPQDFNVRLKVEKNGKVYLSETADNTNSTLEITGVAYYGKNSNGKDVYKISGNVSANVREMGSLKTYPMTFSVIFGVEIP